MLCSFTIYQACESVSSELFLGRKRDGTNDFLVGAGGGGDLDVPGNWDTRALGGTNHVAPHRHSRTEACGGQAGVGPAPGHPIWAGHRTGSARGPVHASL